MWDRTLLRMVTRFQTEDEFMSAMAPYVYGRLLYVATRKLIAPGPVRPFAMVLRTGEAMLAGMGRVVDGVPTWLVGRYVPGIILAIEALDRDSEARYRLLAFAEGSGPVNRTEPGDDLGAWLFDEQATPLPATARWEAVTLDRISRK